MKILRSDIAVINHRSFFPTCIVDTIHYHSHSSFIDNSRRVHYIQGCLFVSLFLTGFVIMDTHVGSCIKARAILPLWQLARLGVSDESWWSKKQTIVLLSKLKVSMNMWDALLNSVDLPRRHDPVRTTWIYGRSTVARIVLGAGPDHDANDEIVFSARHSQGSGGRYLSSCGSISWLSNVVGEMTLIVHLQPKYGSL